MATGALANANWEAEIVSPRAGVTPAAAAIVFCSWATVAGGTDLSTISATLSLLIAPGAMSLDVIVLFSAHCVLLTVWL